MKASACTFLNRFSVSSIRQYAPLFLNYMDKCPVMKHHHSRLQSTVSNENAAPAQASEEEVAKCPFLTSNDVTLTKASESIQEDTIDRQQLLDLKPDEIKTTEDTKFFNYDGFFSKQLQKKKDEHTYRVFKKVMRDASSFPHAYEHSKGEKDITVWCSNDYLGMSWHPKVKAAVSSALSKHGAGSGGTRNISGNSPLHENLEAELAKLHQKEAGLVFTSCYVANDTTLFTLGKQLPGMHFFSDAGNHASMIQGIRTSMAKKHVFRHNDPEHLEEMLQKVDPLTPKVVAFETVHSMDGSICPTVEMCDVAHKYGALTFVDEVHAVGLYGDHGAGVGEQDNCLDKMDIISGTLGKAFGNMGGYIVGSAKMVDMIRSYGSGFIFTTSLPPTVLSGCLASVKVLASEEGQELRARQQSNVRYLREKLVSNGLPAQHSPSHIIPVMVGDAEICTKMSNDLISKYGVYVQSINYPTVAKGTERLRIAPTPHHTREMMDRFVGDLTQLWKDSGLEMYTQIYPENCESCRKPLSIEKMFHSQPICQRSNCTYASLQAALV
ncbi:5-aminolevulinate synthase, erythroid-specific, mitochondrial [Aplysia californica]|uniref:5-aminolevulinate synthase n=1 Tax=Aplysia californica TaxID=6500 RepID=A0ABM1A6A3_APLCA|nr:5-aminolevulinate synthase, erythroid-specific, mitochondrial [Aplysia californica]XP_012941634.1 5-aminolevulinate synthase, erythroid-specific, mitochondrial [Aplysia californica]XP_012941635.1 5-aminolevulinate synthase, erythroid-specific, mitochondrial [Aplysia californica]XP_012941636.1 5-aminolevulinate synthase, erythroid-specific, mitochondrial [Aplysia californica]XP_012941637.1 5-aminolevulinate synthase, erythroid-specific, mitochondrial [Aplysia californica]